MNGRVNPQNFRFWSDNQPLKSVRKKHRKREAGWLGLSVHYGKSIGHFFYDGNLTGEFY